MARGLPIHLQIPMFRRRFEELNAPLAADLVDFESYTDKRLGFDENLAELEGSYPQYIWRPEAKISPRTYEKDIVQEAREMVDPFSYGVFKKYKIKELEGKLKKATSLKIKKDKPKVRKKRRVKKTSKSVLPDLDKIFDIKIPNEVYYLGALMAIGKFMGSGQVPTTPTNGGGGQEPPPVSPPPASPIPTSPYTDPIPMDYDEYREAYSPPGSSIYFHIMRRPVTGSEPVYYAIHPFQMTTYTGFFDSIGALKDWMDIFWAGIVLPT